MVSLARITAMSGKPGFAARRTLRPLSTAIRGTSVARPGPSARTATMRPWAVGSSGTDAREVARTCERRQRVVAAALDERLPAQPRARPAAGPIKRPARYQRAVALSRTPWSANVGTGWAGLAVTAAGTTTSPSSNNG